MKPSKLYEALHALIGERVPLHIWGACGVGKSQIVSQVANDLDYDFLDVRAVQLDPVDLRGLPRIAEDQTEWVPPKFLPTSGKGILSRLENRGKGCVKTAEHGRREDKTIPGPSSQAENSPNEGDEFSRTVHSHSNEGL